MHQDHVVADLQMIQHAGLAAGHDPVADLGGSRHDETGGEQAVPADLDVMGDVAEIVELGAGTDPGFAVGRSIDATACPDRDPILDHHFAELGDAMAAPLLVLWLYGEGYFDKALKDDPTLKKLTEFLK